jgi:hypothetical protein
MIFVGEMRMVSCLGAKMRAPPYDISSICVGLHIVFPTRCDRAQHQQPWLFSLQVKAQFAMLIRGVDPPDNHTKDAKGSEAAKEAKPPRPLPTLVMAHRQIARPSAISVAHGRQERTAADR